MTSFRSCAYRAISPLYFCVPRPVQLKKIVIRCLSCHSIQAHCRRRHTLPIPAKWSDRFRPKTHHDSPLHFPVRARQTSTETIDNSIVPLSIVQPSPSKPLSAIAPNEDSARRSLGHLTLIDPLIASEVEEINWLVGMCALIKLNFLFCKRTPLFDALSNLYQTGVWSIRYTHYHSHCKE